MGEAEKAVSQYQRVIAQCERVRPIQEAIQCLQDLLSNVQPENETARQVLDLLMARRQVLLSSV